MPPRISTLDNRQRAKVQGGMPLLFETKSWLADWPALGAVVACPGPCLYEATQQRQPLPRAFVP